MPLLEDMRKEGARAAFAAVGLGSALPSQPSPGSVGMKMPSGTGLPGLPKAPSAPKSPTPGAAPSVGVSAAKMAANVGMGASTSTDGAGAVAGEPADTGRRQRSVIDRALQSNDDAYATSSMPLPGEAVSP